MHIFHICGHIYPFLDGCKKSCIAEIEDIMQKEWIIFQNIPNIIQRWNFFPVHLFPAFSIFSKCFQYFFFTFFMWHFHVSQYRPAYVPSLLFSMLVKHFQFCINIFHLIWFRSIFLRNSLHGICSFPCCFQNVFNIFFRRSHFFISQNYKNIPSAYVPSLLFSMLTGPISPLRCCLQRIFC